MAKHDKKSVPIVNFIYIILTVLIFTDAGYISYFNSLYGEALAFTSLLLTLAMAVHLSKSQNPRVLVLIGFYVAAILLTCAKFQYIPIGVVIAIFSLLFLKLRKDKK